MANRSARRAVVFAMLMILGSLTVCFEQAGAENWIKTDMGKPYQQQANYGLYGVAVGDGNRDNESEVYVTSYDTGHVYQYKWADKNWAIRDIGGIGPQGSTAYADSVIVGDADDDGLNEVYVGGYHWEQGGTWANDIIRFARTDQGWERTQVGVSGYWGRDIDIGDGNNDSRTELYEADYNGNIYMFVKSNVWNSYAIGYADMASGQTWVTMEGVSIGDANNDGYDEVYGVSSSHQAYMFSYAGSSWTRTLVGKGEENPYWAWYGFLDCTIGDADNDGNNELYAASYINASIYMFKFNNGTKAWDRTKMAMLGNNLQTNGICIGDGNSDGKNELYAGCSDKQVYQVSYDKDTNKWSTSSAGGGNGAIYGVALGAATNDTVQKEVYAACADGHAYQFYTDRTPPANPALWSDTHPQTSTWYGSNAVKMNWKDGAYDISGIDGYSFVWDYSASTVPDDTKDAEETSHDVTSTLSDGNAWYFHIRSRDNSLNWNKTANHYGPIYIDTTPPNTPGLAINNGNEYTKSQIVTLSVTATDPDPGSGVGYMAFSNDGNSWSEWEKFSSSRSGWDLTDPKTGGKDFDGTHTVHCKIRDVVGNEIPEVNRTKDDIFLDRVAPKDLGIIIADGAEYTTIANVSLAIKASDPDPSSGIAKMSFSNDGITWSDWMDYNAATHWSLTAGAGGSDADGDRAVYFRVQDRAENIGGPVKDTIFLDRKAPDGLSLNINNGAEFTTDPTVILAISATDPSPGSQVNEMSLANTADNLGTWEGFASGKRGWSLISGTGGTDTDGDKVVYLQARDKAGNVGGPVKDTIFLDRAKPSPLGILINNDDTYTISPDVTLLLKASDPDPGSGVYAMQFSDDASKWSDWEPFVPKKAYTLPSGDGTKIVYFRVKDKAGNVADITKDSIILDTAPPVISNVRVVGITDTSAIVQWTTGEESDSGTEYGTTTAYGSANSDPAFFTAHSIPLKGLTATTTYHFRVFSKDRAGNLPSYSGDYVFITAATPDTTPPIISNVQVAGITDRLAVITWTTNEPSDSIVEWGKDTVYGMKVFDANFVLKHSVTLKDLSPLMSVHFRVGSKDPSGNGPAFSSDYSFTTLATPDVIPPTISNVKVTGITDALAVVSWETSEPADGKAEYGNTTSYGLTMSDSRVLHLHELTLTGLKPYTIYHFRVLSKDATGNGPSASDDLTFMTAALPDVLGPSIANVRIEGITENSASVIWETDEVSDSNAEYGTTVSYGGTASDATNTVLHSLLIQGLAPGITYHLRVRSTDPSGNAGTSIDYTFKTKKTVTGPDITPPVITGIEMSATNTRAVIIWQTDELAGSEVEFGNTTAYGLRASDAAYTMMHSVVLDGLKASTTYHFRVKSSDVFGNGPSTSIDYSFTTTASPDLTPPRVYDIKVTSITNNSAIISWQTDEPASGAVEYGVDSLYGRNITTRNLVYNHTTKLTGLLPGLTYHFRITASADSSGNAAPASADGTFTTLKTYVPPGPGPGPVKPTDKGAWPTWWWMVALVAGVGMASVFGAVYYRRRLSSRMPADVSDEEMVLQETDDADLDADAAADAISDESVETVAMDGGDVETVSMEDAQSPGYGRTASDVETVDMGDASETVEMVAPAPSAGAAAVLAATVSPGRPSKTARPPAPEPEPVKHIKCPACKTRIPIFNEGPQEVQCPSCGKTGPYKPKTAAPAVSALTTMAKTDGQTPVRTIKCTGCGSAVPIFTTNYPVRIQCSGCGKSGMYKGPKR